MSYQIASVLPTRPVSCRFDYRVPDSMTPDEGSIVTIALGNSKTKGVIDSLRHAQTPPCPDRSLKDIIAVHPHAPALTRAMRRFIDKSARYTCTPTGRMLTMVLGSHGGIEPSPVAVRLTASGSRPQRMTPQRDRVLRCATHAPVGATALARRAGVSPTTIAGLVACGALVRGRFAIDAPFDRPDPDLGSPWTLTAAQADAADRIGLALAGGDFRAIVLDGVTGSGKTRVYMEAVARALHRSATGQILVLTPEIALAEAVAAQLERRFSTPIPLWHAEVSQSVKRRIWRETAHGRARIVVGARSALFLPFEHLSLIVVDEEHDASYKQDEGIIYQARDLAVLRASIEKATVVLASATPSLETVYNVRLGRYDAVALPDRYGAAALPDVTLTDLARSRPAPGKYLSPDLIAATRTTLEAGQQVLYFLNRRGYAPLVMCRCCGQRLKSPGTESWLAEHRASGTLVCHVTGFSMPRPRACPSCGGEDTLTGVGPGIERIAEESCHLFPAARIETLSSDSAGERAHRPEVISRMESGEIDILIGTQIVAKGHHFPNLTLVGVIDADSGLSGTDPRASERTWQVLCQVSGRAGRTDLRGRAILQTHYPDTAILRALTSGVGSGFVEAEMAVRRQADMPPYGRLGAVIVSARSGPVADEAAAMLARSAPRSANIDIWGPAPAQISVLRHWHRRRFLVRCGRGVDMSGYLRQWRSGFRPSASVRVVVDVDPYTFF